MSGKEFDKKRMFKYLNLTPFSKLTHISYQTLYRIIKDERDASDKEMQCIRTALQYVEDSIAGIYIPKEINIEREVDALVSDFMQSETCTSSRYIYADCTLSVCLYSKYYDYSEGLVLEVAASQEKNNCDLSLQLDKMDKGKIVNSIKRLMRVFAY